jgi:MoaA/NifB/PqqE/SkfB family radical SAM enzyme
MPEMREVEVRVTNRCNALCAHCGASSAPTEKGTLATSVSESFLTEFVKRWGAPAAWKFQDCL